jgi:hypothetical protein
MQIVCETQEQLNSLKEKALKVKVIALSQMEKSPITNTSFLTKKDKRILMEKMTELFTKPDEEINEKFKTVVNEEVLDNGRDVSNYPVYYTQREKYIVDNDYDEVVEKFKVKKDENKVDDANDADDETEVKSPIKDEFIE